MRRTCSGRPSLAPLLAQLGERGLTLATAESLTGGRLAAEVTAVPGASAVYLGGVVTYGTELKQSLLGIDPALVKQHGVVSAECARAMAHGVRALTGASYALSTTGVAGPDPQEGKPPGVVYVGLSGPDCDTAVALDLTGDRHAVQTRTCTEAFEALRSVL